MATTAAGKTMDRKTFSAKTGLHPGYVEKLEKHGYVKPQQHFDPRTEPVPLPPGPLRGLPQWKRKEHPDYKGSEAERIDMVDQARQEGRVVEIPRRVISTEERFERFWNLPRGKQRLLNPRTRAEIENLERGYPADTADRPVFVVSPGLPGQVTDYGRNLASDEDRERAQAEHRALLMEVLGDDIDALVQSRVAEILGERGDGPEPDEGGKKPASPKPKK